MGFKSAVSCFALCSIFSLSSFGDEDKAGKFFPFSDWEPRWESLERGTVDPSDIPVVDFSKEECDFSRVSGERGRIENIAEKNYAYVMKNVSTPVEAAAYLSLTEHGGDDYDDGLFGGDYWMSFRQFHDRYLRKGDCDDGAVASASLLMDDGVPPYVVFMAPEKGYGHLVHLVRTERGFYSLGSSEGDRIGPYSSVGELVQNIGDYEYIAVYNLGAYHSDFAYNSKNNKINLKKEILSD